jgi:hypothetical protein
MLQLVMTQDISFTIAMQYGLCLYTQQGIEMHYMMLYWYDRFVTLAQRHNFHANEEAMHMTCFIFGTMHIICYNKSNIVSPIQEHRLKK